MELPSPVFFVNQSNPKTILTLGYYFTTCLIDIKEKDIAKFLRAIANQNIFYDEISIEKPTLEDYFMEVAKK